MQKLYYILLSFFIFQTSFASIYIDINKGNIDPIPIAITPFIGHSEQDLALGEDIKTIILSDLHSSGLIKIIDEVSYLENIVDINITPNFELWKNINSTALIISKIFVQNGNIETDIKIWDSFAGKIIFNETFNRKKAEWRKLSHIVADAIYHRLTGEYPYFDTKISYIAESTYGSKKIKRLALMDHDGENNIYLTNGETLVLTPRMSPDSSKILYLSFAENTPKVHLRDLRNNRDIMIGNFSGMSFAPRFSPDGTKAVLSISRKGASNIYSLDLRTLEQKQLTSGNAIDTSPSFSPNGKKIVFTSDRNGSPKLYTMDSDGSNILQISTGKGVYTTPVWSPREDLIAFTRLYEGRFYIGVIRPDGSGERLLTDGYMVEGPSWAPNGRVIAFTKSSANQKGRWGESKIHTIDITGFNEREIITPQGASDPAWSNILH